MLFVESPFTLFVSLLIISYWIYHRYFRHVTPTVTSGSIVMALDVFALECLPELGFPPSLMLIVALWLFIIWLYISIKLMQMYLTENIVAVHLSQRLSIGYWVSGTVLAALLLDQAEHTLHGFIVLLSIIAICLYAFYFIIIVKWLWLTIRKKFRTHLNGVVMLSTVSTQAVALLFIELFGKSISIIGYQIIISVGVIMFIVGLISILHYTLNAHLSRWLASGSNANTLIYGALSVTGLAILNSDAFPDIVVSIVWWSTIGFFFIIEIFEFARLFIRIKIKGVKKGIFAYTTSQWSRVFAFGILYGFTLSYNNQEYSTSYLVSVIANYGQYIVAALLIVQLLNLVLSMKDIIGLKQEIKE